MENKKGKEVVEILAWVGMLMGESAQVGLMIFSKQAFSTGMPTFVFVTYSNALASLLLLPLSLFLSRSWTWGPPPLTFYLIGCFFLLALSGCLAQLFGYTGINYSSPTLGTAMLNLVPGLTFLLAIFFRMEKVYWRSMTFLAKLMGTIVLIGGAFVVSLCQGPAIRAGAVPYSSTHKLHLLQQQSNWVLGGFFLAIDCVISSSWIIIQAVILKMYPAEITVVFFYCLFVTIQSGVATLIIERDPSVWSLNPQLRLIAVLYSGVFGSAFQVGVVSWCLRRKGPVFVSMFKPLGVAIAAVADVIFFGETLYLGRVIGVMIIVVGFYSVMWGKAKEEKISPANQSSLPLLGDECETA